MELDYTPNKKRGFAKLRKKTTESLKILTNRVNDDILKLTRVVNGE